MKNSRKALLTLAPAFVAMATLIGCNKDVTYTVKFTTT